MINEKHTPQLELRWIAVTDETGRTRMEMVWHVPADPATATVTHAA